MNPGFKRIFITPKDIQKLTGISYAGAYKSFKHLADVLEKKDKAKITIFEYAEYNNIKIEDIKVCLDL